MQNCSNSSSLFSPQQSSSILMATTGESGFMMAMWITSMENIPHSLSLLSFCFSLFLLHTPLSFSSSSGCRSFFSFRMFFWVRSYPLFDAYTGPYKVKHRYWTGLLLLVRVCLFLIFSLNSLGDPTVNLLATVTITFCLLSYMSIIGGIYKA